MRTALIALTIAAALAPAAIARADWLDLQGHVHHLNCMDNPGDPACPAMMPNLPLGDPYTDAYRKALKQFTDELVRQENRSLGMIPAAPPHLAPPKPASVPRARGFDI